VTRTSHPLLKTIGSTIRSLRRQQGLSQEALADRAAIDRSYMSSIERGLRNISVLNATRIAAALEVPVCDLLKGRVSAFESHAGLAHIPSGGPEVGSARCDVAAAEWTLDCSLSLG
jgi:transcriptional regulator with XRE-family HTH domain